MTIPVTGSGSFFVRAGLCFGGMEDVNSLVGAVINSTRVTSLASLAVRCTTTIPAAYAAGTAIPQVVAGIGSPLSAIQSAALAWEQSFGAASQIVQNTLVAMYNIDNGVPDTVPLATLTALPPGGITQVLQYLVNQMLVSSDSIQQSTTTMGAQTAFGPIVSGTPTPTGNPKIVCTLLNGYGKTLQMIIPETLTFVTTADAQTGGQQPGNEQISVYSPQAQPPLSYLWPAGSGLTGLALSCVNGAANNSQGNLLTNSDFVNFSTANAPDNWPILVGAAGSSILNGGSGNAYTPGGGSLEFVGDGSTLQSVAQPFNTQPSTSLGLGGTPAILQPNTVYNYCVPYKVSSTPAAGAFHVALLDGSNAIIADDAGNNNAAIQSLTAATTSYAFFTGSFRTPRSLPSTVKFNIAMTTAETNAKNAYFGRVAFAKATQLYAGGPYCNIFSGSVNTLNSPQPDAWTLAANNGYAVSGAGLMALFLDRTFGLRNLGLQFPYSGSPTVADSLIT